MEATHPDPKPTRSDEPEFDLYTIPSSASWFAWDDIHDIERAALREFFDGSSITRTPKVYKEYRDFIINKYREDPFRRLTFTQIRKSLVGDVNLLSKVFQFLDKRGLINFGANSPPCDDFEKFETDKVKVEDGPPNGIRVVAMPNSLKPLSLPQSAAAAADAVESGLKLSPFTSHSDVFFGELGKQKGFLCENCSDKCDSGRYEYTKSHYILCAKCFQDGSFGENKSKEDFKFHGSVDCSIAHGAVWTEAETTLLLESVLKHGDNWDLVLQDVQTKSKLDCISKLIELPFGDFKWSSSQSNGTIGALSDNVNDPKEVHFSLSENQGAVKNEVQLHQQTNVREENGDAEQTNVCEQNGDAEQTDVCEQNGDAVDDGPPVKRMRIDTYSDARSSLMKEVALISNMAGPEVSAAAAEAAVAVLCDETSCPRGIFGGNNDFPRKGLWSPSLLPMTERVHQDEVLETNEGATQPESEQTRQNEIPLTLRLRTAIATALGAAAAHAKSLADEEDHEIENLVATIIEAQLKKLQYKIKRFENLEVIMEKEYAELEELKESFIEERIDAIHRAISSGLSKWRDNSCLKSQIGSDF